MSAMCQLAIFEAFGEGCIKPFCVVGWGLLFEVSLAYFWKSFLAELRCISSATQPVSLFAQRCTQMYTARMLCARGR